MPPRPDSSTLPEPDLFADTPAITPPTLIAPLVSGLGGSRYPLPAQQDRNEAALDAATEALQVVSDEVQIAQEELQSTYEELEAANEKLKTINDEMLRRNTELHRLNDDLHHLQASIHIAFLLLGSDLTVRRFSPLAEKVFNLRATDVGRGFGDIRHNLDAPDLHHLLAEVIETLSLREREMQDRDGRWHRLHARPYYTPENQIDGVVLVLSDIDALKRSEQEIRATRDYAEATLRTTPIPFLVLRADLRVNTASEAFYNAFQVEPAGTEGRLIYEVGNGQWNIPKLRELLEEIIPKRNVFNGFEVTHEFETIGRRTMLLNARRLESDTGQPRRIVLAFEDITERKQASQYARSLLEASLDPLVTISAEGKITDVNVGSIKVTGVAREKLIGTDFSDYFTEPEKAREGYQQVFAKGFVTDYPLTIRHRDGRLTDVHYNASIYKDVSGNVLGVFAAARDITDRKQVEQALRASEVETKRARDYAEATLRTAPIPLLILRADLRVNTANEAFYKNFQVAPTGTEGELIYDLGNGQWNIPKLRELLEEILPKNNFFNDFEITHEFETIGRRTMLLNARRMENEAGQPLQIVLAIEDITERKHAEDALQRSEQEIKAARDYAEATLRTTPIPFLVLRADLRVNTASEAFYNAFKVEPAATEGRLIYEVGNGQWNIPKLRELLEEIIPKKNVFNGFEVTHEFATIGARTMLLNARRMDNAEGVPERILLAIEDITDRKRAEEALRLATVEIERASRAKDDFLAALSHELRTPLTPVLMTAAALADDPALPPDVREQLEMMRRNIELEARLIDDLLDLTRISRGKLQIARVTADIHDLLEQTAEILRSDGLGKQVRTFFQLEAKRHHAMVDPTRLQQVFWNLIKNALKFTPTAGSITVSTRNDAHGQIVVSVEDTGIGIASEALPHVFNAFEQGDIAGQHRFGGLGLGLAISRAIVEVHGGTICARSAGLGHGATFTVTLATVDAPAASALAGTPLSAPGRSLRLLIVEDHEATRTVLKRLLARGGHEITLASTVQEALAAFAAEHFDVVISDLGLPDGSGLDLMRGIQRQRPVPAIALSGYGMEDDLRLTKEAGFSGHLVKPVNLDQLRQMLDQITMTMP